MQKFVGKVSGLFRSPSRGASAVDLSQQPSLRDVLGKAELRHRADVHVVETTSAMDEAPEAQEMPLAAAAIAGPEDETIVAAPAHAEPPMDMTIVQPQARRETLAQRLPIVPQDMLDVVGRENETIRHRCEEIVRKVEEAATLRQDLSAVFGHVDTILKDLERTKAALSQRNAAYTSERDAHHDLKTRHRALAGEHDRLRDEANTLQAEKQKHFDAFADLDSRAVGLHIAVTEKTRALSELSRRSDGERDKIAQMQSEVQGARDEVQRADELIFSMQTDLSASRDHATLVEEDNKTLQANLNESRLQGARLSRSLEDMQMTMEAARQKIDDLEAALSGERGDHTKIRGLYAQESNARRDAISSLQAKVDALSARAEASERLLLEARGQLHGKIDDLRKAERRAQEAQTIAAPLDARLRGLEQENEELRARVTEMETHHSVMSEHSEGLAKSAKAKDREVGAWRAKVDGLSEKFGAEMTRAEEERDHFEQAIARLTEQLDKEKLERSLAEGALEAARKDRQLHQHALAAQRSMQGAARVASTQVLEAAAHGDSALEAEQADALLRRRA